MNRKKSKKEQKQMSKKQHLADLAEDKDDDVLDKFFKNKNVKQ